LRQMNKKRELLLFGKETVLKKFNMLAQSYYLKYGRLPLPKSHVSFSVKPGV